MTEVSGALYMPTVITYAWVAGAIAVGPNPVERWRWWQALALAGLAAVMGAADGKWLGVACWVAVVAMHSAALGASYRPELYRARD